MHFNSPPKRSYILSTHKKSSHYFSLNNHMLQKVDCSLYLGVTLNHDLRWTTHINSITRKASSTLGSLCRNLWLCPPCCRKTAYISLVCSSLENSTVVWDPYQQNGIDKLENIQRCAVCFINLNYKVKDHTPGCVTNMLRNLGLQSLQIRRKQQ